MTRTLIFSYMLFLGGLSLAAEDAHSIPVGQRQLFLDDDATRSGANEESP